jgi:hypothetical protein
MKKIIRITESELVRIVKRVINENFGGDLPPGFTQNDIMSLDDFMFKSNKIDVNEDDENNNDQLGNVQFRTDKELKNLLSKVEKGGKSSKAEPYIHGSTVKGVQDESGNFLDPNKLMSLLSIRPGKILKTESNTKMIKSNVATITIPKYRGLIHDEKNHELKIVNTCPNAHKCIVGCYAGKGFFVTFKNSSERSAQLLTYLFNDYKGWKSQLISEIQQLERYNEDIGTKVIIRWHDSGDFFSPDYLDIAIDIAESTPDVKHYAYTKSVSMVKSKKLPPNFLTRFSYGGLEDKLINKESDFHSDVIRFKSDKQKPDPNEILINFKKYYNIEKDSLGNARWVIKSADDLIEFKTEIAEKYGLDINTVVTFPEVMKKPEGSKPIWNVIVTPSNADNAAFREDVIGVYLLFH